ncbi:MAG: ATP-dependent helicase [Proteobacteria bacterium]|nr:ATP-dependent helicase [Pseudomonadota bacterium]MBU1714863.1 ATP-dependent helicase [Pseudomonadota bacterium]
MQQSLFSQGQAPINPPKKLVSRENLNQAQYEAVTAGDGPVLVIAGAGSGKTRTLVYRMAYLLERGVAPENILLLTFTRKSAQEMLHRAGQLMNDYSQRVLGGTFHAVANLLLRRHGHHLGYSSNFTILDQSDSEGIINLIKSSLELGGAGKRFPTKRVIINIIGKAVNKAMPFAELLEQQYLHLYEYLPDLERIRNHYQKFKFEHGLMDYDDLLVNLKTVLHDFPAVRDEVAARFTNILVDEYQDTNPVQADIVRLMAHGHNNVMVVGDDSQSIYSFRGADFRNIMEFPQIFPGTRVITLEENYRSSQEILTVTNSIIEQATEKYSKKLFSNIAGGAKPVVFGARNETEQARFITDKIIEINQSGVPLAEIAVLFRSGFHSYKLELELTNHRIDFDKRGGLKLTESAHIKDVLSYLRVISNPYDNLAWNRMLLLLDKVGPKTVQNILAKIKDSTDPFAVLEAYPAAKSWAAGFNKLVDLLKTLRENELTPSGYYETALDYYQGIFERIYHDDYPRRSRDLDQLREIISGYDNLQSFIDDTALDPPQPAAESASALANSDKLILSTIHSAKGLEWDTVFVIHLTEGKFPSSQAFLPEEREEERRLLYVAATRARNRLFFTFPREIMSQDRKMTIGGISPFLAEIPAGMVKTTVLPGSMVRQDFTARPIIADRGAKSSDPSSFLAGTGVRHPFFGEGKVEKVIGPRTVEVFFPRHGRKTLHLDYAKLERLK